MLTKAAASAAWNRRADDWQPIETAPRDGTLICGWGPVAWYGSEGPETRSQPKMVQMVWEASDGSIEDFAGWKVPTPTPYEYYCWATHWRPLPKGPTP